MLLTQKLLRYLNGVFDKDARSFAAFRIQHESGAFRWKIADRVLIGYNGDAQLFSVALEGYTLRTLLEHLATLGGVTVTSRASSEQLGLSACALMDGEGRQALSNGDRIDAFTSLLWAYLESLAADLKEARRQIDEALRQVSVKTAEQEWLDEWGGYFGVPRDSGESDVDYATRIVAEVRRPRGNNVAIEVVAAELLGQPVTVRDVREWIMSGLPIVYDGTYNHDAVVQYGSTAVPSYGLFDIDYIYNLESGADLAAYALQLAALVETMRDAGTHLRAMNLLSSQINDVSNLAPTDTADITVTDGVAHDGAVDYSGAVTYSGISSFNEVLS